MLSPFVAGPDGTLSQEGLQNVFAMALLLSGSVCCAEKAVLQALRSTDATELSAAVIFRKSVSAVLTAPDPSGTVDLGVCSQLSILPPELERVVHLPREDRHCFVLRILAGCSREECTGLLNCDVRQIDRQTSRAIISLARWTGPEPAGSFRDSRQSS